MAQIAKITGVKQVLANLKKTTGQIIPARVSLGLKLMGLFFQRESMKIVPVNEGNLRGSAFTRAKGSGLNTVVTVGYTSEYAVYVHEDEEAAHGEKYNIKYKAEIAAKMKGYKTRGKDQRAKFLEKPVREKQKEAMVVFKKVVQI